MASCLLLSVVALGFLVAEAGAQSAQPGTLFVYEGYVRLTLARFIGAVQPATVLVVMTPIGGLIGFQAIGYWPVSFECEALVVWGGDGSMSASCIGVDGYAKFWSVGFYPGALATLQFYLHNSVYGIKGQFVGAPMPH